MRVAAYLQKAQGGLPGSCSQDGRSDKLDLLSPLPLRMCVAHAQEPAEQGGQRCALQMKRVHALVGCALRFELALQVCEHVLQCDGEAEHASYCRHQLV